MEQRIVDLEMRAAFQENAIHEINSVVIRQQRQIEQLQKALEILRGQLMALASSPVAGAAEETPPPHY